METATIDNFIDSGSIITVFLSNKKAVHFDRRQFAYMYEGEEGNIIGREVQLVDDDDYGMQLEFVW